MKRETKLGLLVIVILAVIAAGVAYGLWQIVESLPEPKEGYGWLDYLLAVVLVTFAGSYAYDKVKARNRYHEATIRSGFRTVTVRGYKDANIIALTLSQLLTEERVE